MYMKQVIAFGAGNFYKTHKENIEKEYDIVAFCDNDDKKTGGGYFGKPIISVDDIEKDSDILITSTYKYEIISQLLKRGINENRINLIIPEWMNICSGVRVNKKGIEVVIDGIHIILHNALEESIFWEIYYNEEYNINFQTNSIVIDIGLNVGMATLFFANKKFVSKVYAFEPDKNVYEKALYNIGLNQKTKNKIVTFNVACSNEDKKETYEITPIASAGIRKQRGLGLNTIDVVCVDASKALGTIIDKHYGKESIIMKCDCEGAEYEIFTRLEQTGYFNKIDAFVMEWHCDRRNEIQEIFDKNGYTYVIFNAPERTFGKCYAIKKK